MKKYIYSSLVGGFVWGFLFNASSFDQFKYYLTSGEAGAIALGIGAIGLFASIGLLIFLLTGDKGISASAYVIRTIIFIILGTISFVIGVVVPFYLGLITIGWF